MRFLPIRLHRAAFALALISGLAMLPASAEDSGLQPGDKAPAFTLQDQDGHPETLQSLAGPNGLLVLFNRSADWCPFCKSQFIDLETARRSFEAKGIHVASITYDSTTTLRAFADRRGIHFAMLSDSDSATIDAFGVRNHDAETVGARAGIAIPNYFLIAPDGTIRQRYAETQLLDRATASYVYELIFGSGTAKPQTIRVIPETPQVSIELAQSDLSAAPGARVRLTVKLTPAAGSHLYAEGAEQFGFRPIRIVLDSSTLYQSHPAVYGPSTIIEFAALKERVPAYSTTTLVTQDVWAVRSPETNAQFSSKPDLEIRGTFEYQACTDTVCGVPQSIPVAWKLHIVPSDLDTTRVAAELQRK